MLGMPGKGAALCAEENAIWFCAIQAVYTLGLVYILSDSLIIILYLCNSSTQNESGSNSRVRFVQFKRSE